MRISVVAMLALFASAIGQLSLSHAGAASSTEPELSGNWQIDPQASSLTFKATQNDNAFEGEFKVFSAKIGLDPEHLENAFIRAEIDITSVDAGNDDRNGALPAREWFHVKIFPVATFSSDDIRTTGAGAYIAAGTLTIKGISRPVSLPFSLAIDGKEAEASARLDLLRTAYGVGPKEDWVGDDVAILIRIKASRTD